MKKTIIVSVLILAMCASSVLTGCGSKDSGGKDSDSKKGGSIGSGCAYDFPGTGFGFDLPEGVKITKGFLTTYDIGDVDYDCGVMTGWPVYHDLSEEKYNNRPNEGGEYPAPGYSFNIFCVKDVNTEEEAKEKLLTTYERLNGTLSEDDRKMIEAYEMIHQENGYIWFKSMEGKSDTIREECKDEYNAFYDATDKIISSMKFYTPDVWRGSEEGTNISFETIDLDGNPIKSESLFAQNKITMINIWATTCGPCINEMAELEELNEEFKQKGGAIVGLLDDVWVSNMKYLDEAKSIITDTGVTYTNLCAWDGYDELLPSVGTPTTYFIDSNGKVVGDPIVGASPQKYREKMEEYLSQAQ